MSVRRAMRNARKRTTDVKIERVSTGTYTVTISDLEKLRHLPCRAWSPLLQEAERASR